MKERTPMDTRTLQNDEIGRNVTAERQGGPRLHVGSEVGVLRRVILHRPNLELKRLTPGNFKELLFDDVLWVMRSPTRWSSEVSRSSICRIYSRKRWIRTELGSRSPRH
jgi:hypothetical protein